MALSPGRLRHRITVWRKVSVRNENGGYSDVWSQIAKVWAEVIGIAGREATIGQALQGISSYRVTVRFGLDVTDVDQIKYGMLNLNVRSVTDPTGDREELLILADTASAQKAA
jgi:SPP1 family predicted phage head-tail adaptor